jgi:hypothetical protein
VQGSASPGVHGPFDRGEGGSGRRSDRSAVEEAWLDIEEGAEFRVHCATLSLAVARVAAPIRRNWLIVPARLVRGDADRLRDVEAFYVSLLVLVGVAVTWFAGYVVYKLFRGQS